jgi:branched-chain amino acid transport system ATP-binding protein
MSTLDVEGLSVRFGSVTAVEDVSVSLPPGRLTGLIGPNGAGKTSFIDALTGFVMCTGKITFAARDISDVPAHHRARLGLGRTWQSIELFDDLTIVENLEVGTRNYGTSAILRDVVWPPVRRVFAGAYAVLDSLGIAELAARLPGQLSYGERKLVGIARSLMLEPAFLLLDEPGAGLDTTESRELGRRLRQIAETGIGLLLVDHDMSLVLGSCDHVHVMQFGRLIAQGTPDQVRSNQAVITAYLGSTPEGNATTSAAAE